ncbi:MAG: 16S rRNA (guanine(966)-N(2))-methyltransferase RsmD [Magnetococcales bacterium]|nr:16S rRNA (guanine(966)-N(2))-methyltransferase RsmD [Magnetococcales bacterium]
MLRISGGRFRGRVLAAPRGESIRPTQQRVREALFSMIADRLHGARVLDLCAGCGTLGLEALSRGAQQTLFIDSSKKARALITDNLKKCQCESSGVIIAGSIDKYSTYKSIIEKLGDADRAVDLVFVDPPYGRSSLIEDALTHLSKMGLVDEESLVIVERSERQRPLDNSEEWGHLRSREYGETVIDLYAWKGNISSDA